MKILLIEDNLTITKGLEYALSQKDFKVISASTLEEAEELIEDNNIDLIILDVTLPDGNGFDFYKNKIKDIKTIFLTAKDSTDDIVKGLELGANDYITKPFEIRELLARINRILIPKKEITVGDITYNFDKMEVRKDNKIINLSSLEIKILNLLFMSINKVVTRNYLIESIWEWTGNDVYDNTITVYMKRIREKLDSDIIKTIKGIGYRIDYEK